MRDEERSHRAEAQRLQGVARSMVFDQELFALGGLISEIHDHLIPAEFEAAPVDALKWLVAELPVDPLPMLSRFAGELDVFGPTDSARFLCVLSGWDMVGMSGSREDPAEYNAAQALRLVKAMRGAQAVLLQELKAAREVTMRWMAEVRHDPPATDW